MVEILFFLVKLLYIKNNSARGKHLRRFYSCQLSKNSSKKQNKRRREREREATDHNIRRLNGERLGLFFTILTEFTKNDLHCVQSSPI